MTEQVLIALILAVQAILVAIVTPLAKRLGDVREQVRNSHDINLRDDLDEKHEEILGILDDHGAKITANSARIGAIEEKIK